MELYAQGRLRSLIFSGGHPGSPLCTHYGHNTLATRSCAPWVARESCAYPAVPKVPSMLRRQACTER